MPLDYLKKTLKVKRNDDDMVFIGCSPCQYFSQINTIKNKSKSSRNLLKYFQKFVGYYKPGYVLIENVPGILSDKSSPLKDFKKFLEENNYNFEEKVLDASKYGVPQMRKRYILLASRVREIHLPSPDNKNLKLKDFIGVENGFPKISAGNDDKTDFLHITSKVMPINLERLQNTPHDGGTRLSWKDNPKLQLKAYKGKDKIFVDVYGRLFWNKPSPTLTTKFYSISNGRFAHPVEDRALSLREGATIQTFPTSYKFKGETITINARLIGNAVLPELAKRIEKEINS